MCCPHPQPDQTRGNGLVNRQYVLFKAQVSAKNHAASLDAAGSQQTIHLTSCLSLISAKACLLTSISCSRCLVSFALVCHSFISRSALSKDR